MKKIVMNLLVLSILLTGCTNGNQENKNEQQEINKKQEIRDYTMEVSGSGTNFGYDKGFECGTYLTKIFSLLVDLNGYGYLTVDCINGTNDSNLDKHQQESNEIIKYIEDNNNIKFENYEIKILNRTYQREIYAYKLPLNNISYVYNEYFSTGGGNYFIFVLNDGKIAALAENRLLNGKIEIKIFEEFDNIQYIISGISTKDSKGNITVHAIDKNGEKIDLYDAFYKWFADYNK